MQGKFNTQIDGKLYDILWRGEDFKFRHILRAFFSFSDFLGQLPLRKLLFS